MKHLIDFPERWKRTVGLGLLIVALGVFVTATAGASRLRAVAKKGSSRSGGDHGTPSQAATGSLGCSSGSGLCLNGGRFQVEATWKAPDGSSGAGNAVALTSDSGYFWFFDPNNVELVVKVLNGCDVNGQYWFFSGGLTNLEVGITVTDTATGVVKTYSSPQGTAFQPVIDTAAFGACPHGEASISTGNPEEPAEGASVARPARAPSAMRTFALGCVGTDTALCIDGRFQIEATWQTASGASGLAHAAPLTSGSGYFWFFEPSNVELIVKTLNACSIDQGNWFFAAGLTNVGVLLSITDTFTGEARTYTNPPGTPFLPIQDTGAFAFCPTPTPTPTTTQTPTRTPESSRSKRRPKWTTTSCAGSSTSMWPPRAKISGD